MNYHGRNAACLSGGERVITKHTQTVLHQLICEITSRYGLIKTFVVDKRLKVQDVSRTRCSQLYKRLTDGKHNSSGYLLILRFKNNLKCKKL